jgi:hypothetical protein
MVDRPDWGDRYDASGNALVPAMPSMQDTHDAIVRGEAPTPAIRQALGVEPAPTPAPVPVRDAGGKIIRPDWLPKPVGVHARQDERQLAESAPRNESGQYISRSQSELRAQWENEGGLQANVQRVLASESTMLSRTENPAALQSHIATHLTPSQYWPRGGVVTQRTANPCKPVRFRPWPPPSLSADVCFCVTNYLAFRLDNGASMVGQFCSLSAPS